MSTETKKLDIKRPEIFLLSFAGVGFSPKAPGTMGSLATLPFLFAIGLIGVPQFFLIPILTILTIISCYLTESVQREFGLHDPSWIVFDEVLGMSVAWLFLKDTTDIVSLFAMFGLFRLFDIFKIWPATWFDNLTHGSGTILDDIICGVYAGVSFILFPISGIFSKDIIIYA